MQNSTMANTVGLSLLALLVLVVNKLTPGLEFSWVAWAFFYTAAAAGCMFLWQHPRAPTEPKGWVLIAAISLFGAVAWWVVSRGAARLFFGSDEPAGSWSFDLVMLLLISPGITVAAALGWVRQIILQRRR